MENKKALTNLSNSERLDSVRFLHSLLDLQHTLTKHLWL